MILMNLQDISIIIGFVITGLGLLTTIIGWIKEVINGNAKKFIQEKMAEAEGLGKSGEEKLQYVIEAVKTKYKILTFVIDTKKYVEELIDFSKKVNSK